MFVLKKSSLVVVGSGIKFLSHLTIEAKVNIEEADKVLYLVNEPAIKQWICKANINSESLDKIYFKYEYRLESYKAITNYIIDQLKSDKKICVVLYGHPCVYAKPALDAVCQARQLGYYAKVLPGISAEDCLFSDLLINPGSHGCQSFDATNLLVSKKHIDITCHIIVWQVGVIGTLRHAKIHNNKVGLDFLIEYLCTYYDKDHKIIVYEAAQYAGLEPLIKSINLSLLTTNDVSRISTIYIPPAKSPVQDKEMIEKLGINWIP